MNVMNNLNTDLNIRQALQRFGDEVKACRAADKVLPWSPMLPYVYSRYGESEKLPRYFYIGRDTYGWDLGGGSGFSDFFEKYDANDFAGYLRKNCTALTTEKRMTAWNGYVGSFWYVVNMMHLRLRLGRIPDMSRLTPDEKRLLEEIGYGNLNSIELPDTLKKQKCWEDIDQDKYWKIKESSEKFLDRYDLVQDAFFPMVSIITSWTGEEEKYFRDLRYEKIADKTQGKLKVAVYLIEK
ncbi:MAG: hypothetical protein ACI4QT_08950 [Kiritimatiellia bacterium]